MTVEQAAAYRADDLLDLLGIEISPARLKCAMLSLETLDAALADLGEIRRRPGRGAGAGMTPIESLRRCACRAAGLTPASADPVHPPALSRRASPTTWSPRTTCRSHTPTSSARPARRSARSSPREVDHLRERGAAVRRRRPRSRRMGAGPHPRRRPHQQELPRAGHRGRASPTGRRAGRPLLRRRDPLAVRGPDARRDGLRGRRLDGRRLPALEDAGPAVGRRRRPSPPSRSSATAATC